MPPFLLLRRRPLRAKALCFPARHREVNLSRSGGCEPSPRVCPSGTLRGLSHPEEHLEEANGSPRWVGAGTSADPTGSACEPHRNSPPGLGTRCSKWSPRLAMVRKTFSCSLPVHYENPLKGAFRTTKPFKGILLKATKATLTALAFKSTWVFKLWKTLFYFSKFLCVCFSRLGLLTGFREMFSVIAWVRKCIMRLIPITIFKTICKHILHKKWIFRYMDLCLSNNIKLL